MYVAVIVSPSATCRTPAELVVDRLIVPWKRAVCGPLSVSVTVSPPGSDVEAIVTLTVSTTLSFVFRSQSLTVIVAVLLHGYFWLFKPIEPAREQLTSSGEAHSEKGCGPVGTLKPRTSMR